MLRFSANLSMLFQEYSFLERFDKAAQSGFRGVEFMFPYDYDIDVLKEKLQTNQLSIRCTISRQETGQRVNAVSPVFRVAKKNFAMVSRQLFAMRKGSVIRRSIAWWVKHLRVFLPNRSSRRWWKTCAMRQIC